MSFWKRVQQTRYVSDSGWVLRAGGTRHPRIWLSVPLPCGEYWETPAFDPDSDVVARSHEDHVRIVEEVFELLADKEPQDFYHLFRNVIDVAREPKHLVRGVAKPEDDPRTHGEYLADQLEELMEKTDAEHKHDYA